MDIIFNSVRLSDAGLITWDTVVFDYSNLLKLFKMNIYTHPNEIKEISRKISGKTFIASNRNHNINYHLVDGNFYSVFQEGLGNYPELVNSDHYFYNILAALKDNVATN